MKGCMPFQVGTCSQINFLYGEPLLYYLMEPKNLDKNLRTGLANTRLLAVIAENRTQPPLHIVQVFILSDSVVDNLVLCNLTDREVL